MVPRPIATGGTPKATALGGVVVSRPRELPVRTVRAQVSSALARSMAIGDVEQPVGEDGAGCDVQRGHVRGYPVCSPRNRLRFAGSISACT